MPANTTKGLPYPLPSEPVAEGAQAIRNLAEAVDKTGVYGAPSTTPPASPTDGQLWLFPFDATAGVMWVFRYRAASASAMKWEFVGGPPAQAYVQGDETPGTFNAWTWLPTPGPDVIVPRPGEYRCSFAARVTGGAAAQDCHIAAGNAANAIPVDPAQTASPLTNGRYVDISGHNTVPTVSASQTIRIFVYATGALQIGRRVLQVVPVRVS